MTSQQSSSELIADRYASALYEYSTETKCVDQVLSDLLKIQDYIKHNIITFLTHILEVIVLTFITQHHTPL